MLWTNNLKALGIASFKSIYPEILTSVRVTGIRLINKSYFSVINKTTVASCLEVSKKACLLMIFIPQTFLIVILIIISPVSELTVNLNIILHTTYLTRQEVHQTFVTTCKSMIGFVNLINKRLKCLSLTECSCHVTYAFQGESTLYSCLNNKELLARSRREI